MILFAKLPLVPSITRDIRVYSRRASATRVVLIAAEVTYPLRATRPGEFVGELRNSRKLDPLGAHVRRVATISRHASSILD